MTVRGRWESLVLATAGFAVLAGAPRASNGEVAEAVQQVPEGFAHANHTAVQCYTCHDTSDQHSGLLVRTLEDCRTCHHTAPLVTACEQCHAAAETPVDMFAIARPVTFSVGGGDAARSLAFPHARHADLACARCHTEGVALEVSAALDCASCHVEHHGPQSDCSACHDTAPVTAHPADEAHVTCSGAACHTRFPFDEVLRTREGCLACHQDQRMHEAQRTCVECHLLPAPHAQTRTGP